MMHHPLCVTEWSGIPSTCTCPPDGNDCRACPNSCKECTWDNGTCECYEHGEEDTDA